MAIIGSLGKQMLRGNSQKDSVAAARPGTKRTSVSAAGPSGYVESNATVCVVSRTTSSSAWKGDAVSMISEVIPDNRYQKYPSGINQKLPRREQANGPMSDAIHLGAVFFPGPVRHAFEWLLPPATA